MRNLALALLFGAFAAAAVAAALLAVTGERGRAQNPGAGVEARIGATRLIYAPSLARGEDDRAGGALDALDLLVAYPQFAPPERPRAGQPAAALVFIHLRAQDSTLDPADRPIKLYARFLSPETQEEPGGLILRRFEQGRPYEKEELHLAAPEGRAFFARCTKPANPPDGLGETCLSDLRLLGLDVQYRFSPSLLPEWETLQAGVLRLLEAMAR